MVNPDKSRYSPEEWEKAVSVREKYLAQREQALLMREEIVAAREDALRTQKMAVEEHVQSVERKAEQLREANEKLVVSTIVAQTMTEVSEIDKQEMSHTAHHDVLTGLPNRALLNDRLEQAIASAQRRNNHIAVLFLDLDRFKAVNDTLGHDVGDKLLQAVAVRLQACVRSSDTVSRIGGDEFVVVLAELAHAEDARLSAEKMLHAVHTHGIDLHGLKIGTSIGISIYPFDGQDAENLIKCADKGMYVAKKKGRNNYQFCHSDGPVVARKKETQVLDLGQVDFPLPIADDSLSLATSKDHQTLDPKGSVADSFLKNEESATAPRVDQRNKQQAALELRNELIGHFEGIAVPEKEPASSSSASAATTDAPNKLRPPSTASMQTTSINLSLPGASDEPINLLRQVNEQLVIATLRAQTQKESADLATRQQQDFLARLSHELRNPLAPIRSALGVLQRIQYAEPTLPWIHDVVHRQILHMTRFLDNLLDMTLVTSGKMILEQTPVGLDSVMQLAIKAARPLIDERKQQLHLDLPETPYFLKGDPARLPQVFAHLLHNAARYSPEGGTIYFSAQKEQSGQLLVRVRDDGNGIAPEDLAGLFDQFKLQDRSPSQAGGVRIGLPLVRKFVELQGGSIECHSAGLNQGSEFIVRLPLINDGSDKHSEDDNVIAQTYRSASTSAETITPHHSYRIVLIEDNVDSCESLSRLLRMVGHDVHAALDGAKGAALVEQLHPQVVLCDLGLPEMDGYAVIAHLSQRMGARLPVMIALTGYGQNEERVRALAAGFNHHLTKPVDIESLLKMIATYGDQHRAA